MPPKTELSMEAVTSDGIVLVNNFSTMRLKDPTVDLLYNDWMLHVVDAGAIIPVADGARRRVGVRLDQGQANEHPHDIVKRATASTSRDPLLGAATLDLTSMSFAMTNRVYTMAQAKASRNKNVIVTLGILDIQEGISRVVSQVYVRALPGQGHADQGQGFGWHTRRVFVQHIVPHTDHKQAGVRGGDDDRISLMRTALSMIPRVLVSTIVHKLAISSLTKTDDLLRYGSMYVDLPNLATTPDLPRRPSSSSLVIAPKPTPPRGSICLNAAKSNAKNINESITTTENTVSMDLISVTTVRTVENIIKDHVCKKMHNSDSMGTTCEQDTEPDSIIDIPDSNLPDVECDVVDKKATDGRRTPTNDTDSLKPITSVLIRFQDGDLAYGVEDDHDSMWVDTLKVPSGSVVVDLNTVKVVAMR
ncbi:hypothetical protein F5Y19DRAFT_486520 [Xylariaceae sp. FL1651]|nr:hypothetical protein F5Y19DRAFT_486520 [Xylariaceae sp. FL1651]